MNERDTTKKELSERFEQVLIARGYEHATLAELKAVLGVSRTVIHNWKSGKHIPSLYFAGIICAEFQISFEWLMTGNGTMDGFIMKTPDELALISKYRDLSDQGKQKTINFIFTECVEYEITAIQKKANAEKQATLKLIT